MPYQTLKSEFNNKTAIVYINRPDKLNALNSQVISEEKAFVAGADISELNKLNMIAAKEYSEKGQAVFNRIKNMNKPVIAAVNGFALGGGCELALSCHIRLASENAKFGQPEVNLGLIPGFGGTQRLTRLINSGRAMELILSGDIIDAGEAFRLGLVNRVYPINELMNKASELADKIASKSQYAVKQAVKAINICDEVSGSEGLNYEASLFSLCCGTEDFREGTSAFLEKRKPVFKNQ